MLELVERDEFARAIEAAPAKHGNVGDGISSPMKG
jgi:hypothetical protein